MSKTAQKKHRTYERIIYDQFIVMNDSLTVKAIDISEGGIYVLTRYTFKPGDVVSIAIPYRNEKIEIKARVKHCQEGIGLGLMFIDLDTELKAKINRLIVNIKK